MSTDRELLEAAARAAGHKVYAARQAERDDAGHGSVGLWLANGCTCWNPLASDADAFRLFVDLGLVVDCDTKDGFSRADADAMYLAQREPHGKDPAAATRRAIVRAAAAIAQEPPCPKT